MYYVDFREEESYNAIVLYAKRCIMDKLLQIRENERLSHVETYNSNGLFEEGSWLHKPVKTVTDLLPYFSGKKNLRILDLGCGVGRNCIAFAKEYKSIGCTVDCVDLLSIAIEKLNRNAETHGVTQCINGIVKAIEDYEIEENRYDLIMSVSALEHIDSEESFKDKLAQISAGIRNGGIVCLVINSEVTEEDKATGEPMTAQFEVNMASEELQRLLKETFCGWRIVKETLRKQQYDIPRGEKAADLTTNVVTFVAVKDEAERCPYCGGEMKNGFVCTTVKSAVFWAEEKTSFFKGPAALEGAEVLAKSTSPLNYVKGSNLPAAKCENCGRIILENIQEK